MESVVRPLLAISRLAGNGERNPNETIKRQEIIITTAGVKESYAYSRLLRNLIRMVTEPGKAIVLGGSYRIPILAGLQDMDWIREMKMSGTFNPASFPREFLSKWSSGSDTSYFPADTFDKLRSLKDPVFEREANLGNNVEYFFGIDVGRFSDTSEVTIVKRIPQVGAASMKHLVNIVSFEKMSFPEQAMRIKILYQKYKPKACIIDGAGIGSGLIDELVVSQIDPDTREYLAPWSIINDNEGKYTQFKTTDALQVLYVMKASAPFNTQMYTNMQTQLLTGKLRFLVDERQARLKLEASRAKQFKDFTEDDRIDYLLPFYQTSILKSQMINLESINDGVNLIMKRANTGIKKDKVSSLGYCLYYIKTELDDREMMRKSMSIHEMFYQGVRTNNAKTLKNRISFKGNRNYSSNLRKNRY